MFPVLILILLILTEIGHSTPIQGGQDERNKIKVLTTKQSSRIDCNNSELSSTETNKKKYIAKYPYVVFIEAVYRENKEGSYVSECGGIILDTNTILTAGHCLDVQNFSSIEEFIVYAGVTNLDKDLKKAQIQKIKAFKVHKGYAKNSPTWWKKGSHAIKDDIAILWLKEPLKFNSKIQKAALPTEFKIKNEYGIALGWGVNEQGVCPSKLQSVKLKVLRNSECKKLGKESIITSKLFCVISDDRKCGTSFGDSGGPFIINNVVYGLVSSGTVHEVINDNKEIVITCDPSIPQVFTNLFKYLAWIKKVQKESPPTKHCTDFEKDCAF